MKRMIMHSAVYVPIDWLGGLDGKILSGHKDRAYIQMYRLSTVTAKYFPSGSTVLSESLNNFIIWPLCWMYCRNSTIENIIIIIIPITIINII